MQKSVIFAKKKIENEYLKDRKYYKVRVIIIIQKNIEVLHIAYAILI